VERDLPDPLDDDYVHRLLTMVTLDDIAEAWCRHTSQDRGGIEDPDWWAVAFVLSSDLARNSELHRATLLKLLEHADSELLVGCVGAGPLEDFISEDEDDLRWLEAQAAANVKLRTALGGVWIRVSEPTFERLDRAAGRRLRRPTSSGVEHPVARRYREARDRIVGLLGPDWIHEVYERPPTPEVQAAHDELMGAIRAIAEVTPKWVRGTSSDDRGDRETD
jgi:hypothetical protein